MLFIGDIHINARFQDAIIQGIQDYIDHYPQEQNIIFCGDFVYHFSYDRNALLALYKYFLQLLSEKKNVYILAGNHDRLGNSFVFEEAKRAFDIINSIAHDQGKMLYITQPTQLTIEGQEILFLPFTIDYHFKGRSDEEMQNLLHNDQLPHHIQQTCQLLQTSKNKNEVFSGYLNAYLRGEIQGKKDLLVVHHYYINNTKFPGQKSKFSYKDVALHEDILNQEQIRLVSGHLHQAFSLNNYLCLGSVRSTTPLESNQMKYLFSYNPNQKTMEATEIAINPYLVQEYTGTAITQEDILAQYEGIRQQSKQNISSPVWDVTYKESPVDLHHVSLSIKTDSIDYQKIDQYIAPQLRQDIKDIKLKKDSVELDQLLKNFEISAKNLSTGFADWKDILKSYLQQKHSTDYEKYETKLKEMKLL